MKKVTDNMFDKESLAFKKKYKLDNSAFWECHNKPIITHKWLEIIAEREGIDGFTFEVVECDTEKGVVVVKGNAKKNKRVEESFGESHARNNRNAYPVAMAEKRCKDRLITKLLGVSGFLYSESDLIKHGNQWDFADETDFGTEEVKTTKEEIAQAMVEVEKFENEKPKPKK
tara:strand:- start:1667 stop:2182 length:516 start_codon:yes stop_codon:yes gene_type:complete